MANCTVEDEQKNGPLHPVCLKSRHRFSRFRSLERPGVDNSAIFRRLLRSNPSSLNLLTAYVAIRADSAVAAEGGFREIARHSVTRAVRGFRLMTS